MASDGGSHDDAVASAPRRLDGRVAFAALAASGLEELLPDDVTHALVAMLRDLLQLPTSKGNGGAPGLSADEAAACVDEAHEGLHGDYDLHQLQLLWALCAQLRACPALADCADLGAYIVKKYAPAAARAGKLVPAKNQRFAEFARVLALEECALYAEFDPDAEAEGESEDDGAADSDYNSDDNSADAQMHRFFSKVESLGVPLCEDLADPWA